MAAEPRGLERWLALAGAVIAPASLLSGLLFYFGYASTRAKFAYFGVDVDVVGLDTRDVLLRSPQPLLVPVVMLALLVLLGVWLHIVVRAAVRDARAGGRPRRLARLRRAAAGVVVAGAGVLAVGVALVVGFAWLREWALYDMVTPLALSVGVVALAYGRHVRAELRPAAQPDPRPPGLRRLVAGLCVVVVTGSLFWATATLARWSGRGQGVDLAERLTELPGVVLDTRERLYVRDPVIEESVLPVTDGQTYRYRYRRLRLLLGGDSQVFLVPEQWSPSGSTLLVPLDDSVRVQFRFENPSTGGGPPA